MKYVIIGNSAAATGAVEGIRATDKSGEITVVSRETGCAYSRPLISYLLEGKTDEERMKYRPEGFAVKNGVTLLDGRSAVALDAAKKTVALDDGMVLPYDRLLLAVGSRPLDIPFEGIDGVSERFSFMTLADARALRAALKPESRVLIIGAGLIGLKCAEGIRGLCGELTVVDLAPRVLSSVLDEETSDTVQAHIEKNGVKFVLGHTVKAFHGGKAELDNGVKIDFDVLVTAIGVRPNTELASAAGARVERGIVTDRFQRTSLPDVYAAGDCALSHDVSCNKDRILAVLPNAYFQGEAAGVNMAGGEKCFEEAIPMNAGGFFGLHIATAGSYEGDCYTEHGDGTVKKLFYGDGYLNGYIMVGDIARAGIYTRLIKRRVPLSEIDFPLICKNPSLMAFGRKYRDEWLGGIKQ